MLAEIAYRSRAHILLRDVLSTVQHLTHRHRRRHYRRVDAGALPGFPQTTKIVSFTGSEDLGDFLVDASAGFAETITLGGKEYAGNNGFTDEYKSLRAEWLTSSFCDGAPRVLVTGHSLGGAMANYGAVELRNMGCKVDLVTLGAPRAFDDDGWKWRY